MNLMQIPGLGGILQARGLNQQAAQQELQQAQGLIGILSQVQQQQQRQAELARQNEYRGALSAAKTPEEAAAVARKYGTPNEVLSSFDRQTTAANTKEMAIARLRQAATQGDQVFQLRKQAAKTAQEAAQVDQQWKQFRANVEQERLKYDTGSSVPSFMLPPMQDAAPAPQQGVDFNFGNGMRGTVPDEQTAIEMFKRLNQGGAPAAAPAQAPAPAAAPAQQPVTAPGQPQPAAPMSPTMPQFTGSPREQAAARNKWIAEQAAAGNFGNKEVVRQVTKSLEENYTRLRDAPTALENIEKAKELIPSAKLFQGSLGEQKLAVAKFFNNNLGTSINLAGVSSAEELRSRIFFNIMDNLKKMDAQPSQLQQQIMQDALGKLGTDPSALGNILDAFGDTIRDKVKAYDTQVLEAKDKAGINWPHSIKIPTKKSGPSAVREFATEAEAAAAGLAPGTRIKIGGKSGTWQ